jgi:exosome complex RNA-binding protein Rrp4
MRGKAKKCRTRDYRPFKIIQIHPTRAEKNVESRKRQQFPKVSQLSLDGNPETDMRVACNGPPWVSGAAETLHDAVLNTISGRESESAVEAQVARSEQQLWPTVAGSVLRC